RDDLRENGDERAVALDVLAIDGRDLAQHRKARRALRLRNAFELTAQQIGKVVERSRLPIEALQRLACIVVRRIGAEQRAPLLDRLLRVCAFFGELRDLTRELRAIGPVGKRALRIGQDLNETRLLALLRTPLAEEVEHADVRRLVLAQALEIRLGRLR